MHRIPIFSKVSSITITYKETKSQDEKNVLQAIASKTHFYMYFIFSPSSTRETSEISYSDLEETNEILVRAVAFGFQNEKEGG